MADREAETHALHPSGKEGMHALYRDIRRHVAFIAHFRERAKLERVALSLSLFFAFQISGCEFGFLKDSMRALFMKKNYL